MADGEKRNITDEELALRRKLAIMCRILGMQKSIGLYGHVSIRIPGTDIVLMTPGAGTRKDRVRVDQIFVFDMSGKILQHPGGDRPMQIPAEWRIHTQIHKDRPEIGCIAHLHAHASTLMGIARREIVPVFSQGGFLYGGMPTWDDPRMVLDDKSAVSLSQTLGKAVASTTSVSKSGGVVLPATTGPKGVAPTTTVLSGRVGVVTNGPNLPSTEYNITIPNGSVTHNSLYVRLKLTSNQPLFTAGAIRVAAA